MTSDTDWLDAGEHIRCTACDEVAYYGDDEVKDCKHCGEALDYERTSQQGDITPRSEP